MLTLPIPDGDFKAYAHLSGLRARSLGRAIQRVQRSLERTRGRKQRARLLERIARLTEQCDRIASTPPVGEAA